MLTIVTGCMSYWFGTLVPYACHQFLMYKNTHMVLVLEDQKTQSSLLQNSL